MKTYLKNKLKSAIESAVIFSINSTNSRGKCLDIPLEGGLCNKLLCMLELCELAINKNSYVLEPNFGWKEKILFSDIFDIEHFNETMKDINNGKDIIIQRKINSKPVKKPNIRLWNLAEKKINTYRKTNEIPKNSLYVKFLSALRLNPKNEVFLEKHLGYITSIDAFQVRIESDWVSYSQVKEIPSNETLVITPMRMIEMVGNFSSSKDIFFTTGENQELLKEKFEDAGFNSDFFYDPSLEYEVNAAINFFICSHAKSFTGLSRSSFSNLISLYRAVVLGNENSYIYNYKNSIHLNTSHGLHAIAADAACKKTKFI